MRAMLLDLTLDFSHARVWMILDLSVKGIDGLGFLEKG